MAIKAPPMTGAEFEKFSMLRENDDHLLELIGGEVVEVASDQVSGRMGAQIGHLIAGFHNNHKSGYLTAANGGYRVGNDYYLPSIGYISKARQPVPSDELFNSLAPDLAVVIVRPSDAISDMLARIVQYQLAGTTVWLVYSRSREIQVFTPGQPTRKLGIDDILDGGEVLPGFTAKVQDIFAGE